MGPSYLVHISGSGNVFMREIASLVVAALQDLGRDAELCVEKLPARAPGQINLVIAPHEFFPLLKERSDEERRRAAAVSVCIGTEQPGTPWFKLSTAYARLGPLALDINPLAVETLRRHGIDAHHLQLGYHPSQQRWRQAPDEDRPIDILFLGAKTARRENFLARNSAFFSAYNCELRLFGFEKPVSDSTPSFLCGEAKYKKLAAAKLLLNVHRSEVPYFEWVRAIEAMANGCVLLTEPSRGSAPLESFRHFVSVPMDTLIGWAGALLADPAWRDQLAADAHKLLRERLHFTDLLAQSLPLVEEAASRPPSLGIEPTPPGSCQRDSGPVAAAREKTKKTLTSLSHRLQDSWSRAWGKVGRRRKNRILSQRLRRRQAEAEAAALQHGDPRHADLRPNAAYRQARPEVTVVLPLFNYENHVGVAIDSVVASVGVRAELIVVDDHSSDNSRSVVEAKQAEYPWFPILLVAKAANAGLSAARNSGFSLARSEMVFPLDADNTIYPACLRLLADKLADEQDTAFAYGLVERHGDLNDLVNDLPWDVERLCRGNYIDAMAMIRRSVWAAVGGYDSSMDERFGGCEDYEFWLHLAALGHRGMLVPQAVARYWSHGGSMVSLVKIDLPTMFDALRARYPQLPWPH